MRVDDKVRERAVLSLFRAHRRTRGACLSHRELERDWRRIHLRLADLSAALTDLTQRGLLDMRQTAVGTDYALTYLGEQAARSAPLVEPVTFLRSWFALQRARLRRPSVSGGDPVPRRRADDPR